MDLNEQTINRNFLTLFFKNYLVNQTFRKLAEQEQKRAKIKSTKFVLESKEKSLIYPHTNNYLQSSDYYFLKCKRENYKDLNVGQTIKNLGIELIEIEEVRKDSNIIEDLVTETREDFVISEARKVSNKDIIRCNVLNNPTGNVVDMIKGTDISSFKEYIPKSFKIININK
jgi:hypothetical protein